MIWKPFEYLKSKITLGQPNLKNYYNVEDQTTDSKLTTRVKYSLICNSTRSLRVSAVALCWPIFYECLSLPTLP